MPLPVTATGIGVISFAEIAVWAAGEVDSDLVTLSPPVFIQVVRHVGCLHVFSLKGIAPKLRRTRRGLESEGLAALEQQVGPVGRAEQGARGGPPELVGLAPLENHA